MENKDLAKLEEELVRYDGVDKICESYEARELTNAMPQKGLVNSGLSMFDRLAGSFEKGEIVTISGKSGGGKTTFLQSLTYHFAQKEFKCLWFTYEVSPKAFLKRFVSLPFFYLPVVLVQSDLEWIERKIIECKVKYGVDVVFIDHLHYIIPPKHYQNMSILIGQAMREFKRMVSEHNIVLFLTAHPHKIPSEQDITKEDIRDSSFIGSESDMVIIVKRMKEDIGKGTLEYTNKGRVTIDKNRRLGTLGYVNMRLKDNIFWEESKIEPREME